MLPGLGVSAVARRLGVAPATLRTWDRRYGLGPTEHVEGSHRRYSEADLARLERMMQLVRSGFSPRDAAALVLAEPGVPQPTKASASGPWSGVDESAVLPVRGLRRAMRDLDIDSAAAILQRNLGEHGVVWTWERLVVPVLIGIGDAWEESGRGVEAEHALSEVISSALRARSAEAVLEVPGRPVLLAAAPNELHTLALEATAAALAERGIGARLLGARVPLDALEMAVRRTGPQAVMVWATNPTRLDLNPVLGMRPRPRAAVAGPGWDEVPSGWARFDSLPEAVEQLAVWAGTTPVVDVRA